MGKLHGNLGSPFMHRIGDLAPPRDDIVRVGTTEHGRALTGPVHVREAGDDQPGAALCHPFVEALKVSGRQAFTSSHILPGR